MIFNHNNIIVLTEDIIEDVLFGKWTSRQMDIKKTHNYDSFLLPTDVIVSRNGITKVLYRRWNMTSCPTT